MSKWYAVYKGDQFIVQGTKEECAKFLGIKPVSVEFMATPTYLKRRANSPSNNYLIVLKVDDEE